MRPRASWRRKRSEQKVLRLWVRAKEAGLPCVLLRDHMIFTSSVFKFSVWAYRCLKKYVRHRSSSLQKWVYHVPRSARFVGSIKTAAVEPTGLPEAVCGGSYVRAFWSSLIQWVDHASKHQGTGDACIAFQMPGRPLPSEKN